MKINDPVQKLRNLLCFIKRNRGKISYNKLIDLIIVTTEDYLSNFYDEEGVMHE